MDDRIDDTVEVERESEGVDSMLGAEERDEADETAE